jgi:addiction module HigA family antidote
MNKIEPIHAGEILLEEFMQPFGISQNALAKALKVTPRRINEIVNRKRAITADTALRLSKFFGNSAEFWMNLQNRYELEVARDNLFSSIDKEVELYPAILDGINRGGYLGSSSF